MLGSRSWSLLSTCVQLNVESVELNSVSVMHSTEGTDISHLCQYRVSGKEFGYKQAIQKQLKNKIKCYIAK